MPTRSPIVAGMFYPADEPTCRRQVRACLEAIRVEAPIGTVHGGVVPHAGWVYSGPTAGTVFQSLTAQEPPETFILFGAVHTWGVSDACLYGHGTWRTPLGELAIDEELAAAIASHAGLADRPEAHAEEHSIEVQLPFIKHLFPSARIVPIAMPPLYTAHTVGQKVAQAVRQLGRRAVALGSTDLTHYGPRYGLAPAGSGERALAWVHNNDKSILDLMLAMRAEEIVPEARSRHNACGAGAVAAAIAFAAEMGAAQGVLLHYTTSHEVMPTGRATDMVGYGAVVFIEPRAA